MLIQGKHCNLETEDERKGRAIINYMDFIMEKYKDAIVKETVDAYMENRKVKVDFLNEKD